VRPSRPLKNVLGRPRTPALRKPVRILARKTLFISYTERHKIRSEDLFSGLLVPADVQESEVFPEQMEAYLLELLYRCVVSETQYDLLMETKVYRRMSQREWAASRGVPPATVRSWRHRAEQAIREHEKARRRQSER